MKGRLLAACLCTAFLIGYVVAYAAPTRLLLPHIANGQAPPTLVTLIDSDSSFVSAAAVPGTSRILVSYIDRSDGNRLHVVEDLGDHVVEVQLPPLASTGIAPAAPGFTPPGPKQADSALVIIGTRMHLYYTSRDEDDPTGPFKLKRLSMAVPPPAQP